MRLFFGTGFFLVIALHSCGTQKITSYTASNQPVNSDVPTHAVDSLVTPYREGLQVDMSRVIGHSDSSLLAYAPESPLGNFVADVVFEAGFQYASTHEICSDSNAIFSLLNFGGLRTSITQGPITRGDIYELMPFDNTVVIVKISKDSLFGMLDYFFVMKGQPVSNIRINLDSAARSVLIGSAGTQTPEFVYVITSDYLANGGDKMNFLKNPVDRWDTGMLMRDVLISYIQKKDTIPYSSVENRVVFE